MAVSSRLPCLRAEAWSLRMVLRLEIRMSRSRMPSTGVEWLPGRSKRLGRVLLPRRRLPL